MLFSDLHNLLLESLRGRIQNGLLTERGLARALGMSQPHMHNVLKGTRRLSLEMSDRILSQLHLSAIDLIDVEALRRRVEEQSESRGAVAWLPILTGRIGPFEPWPGEVRGRDRFRVPSAMVERMAHPVVVQLAADTRMEPLFAEGDLMLLDQSYEARSHIEPNAIYVVKRGNTGLVRHLRRADHTVYMVSRDALDRPAEWEPLECAEHPLPFFVRARGAFVTRELEWAQ